MLAQTHIQIRPLLLFVDATLTDARNRPLTTAVTRHKCLLSWMNAENSWWWRRDIHLPIHAWLNAPYCCRCRYGLLWAPSHSLLHTASPPSHTHARLQDRAHARIHASPQQAWINTHTYTRACTHVTPSIFNTSRVCTQYTQTVRARTYALALSHTATRAHARTDAETILIWHEPAVSVKCCIKAATPTLVVVLLHFFQHEKRADENRTKIRRTYYQE